MAVFDPKSRYVNPPLTPYAVKDFRGRDVFALPMPEPFIEVSVGRHATKANQRLDHLASGYLNDPKGFWRIAELNGAVLPDSLVEQQLIEIPPRTR